MTDCRFTGNEPSPKGFGYCAHNQMIGTIRMGTDGQEWIVKSIPKAGTRRWVPLLGQIKKRIAKSRSNRSRSKKSKSKRRVSRKSKSKKSKSKRRVSRKSKSRKSKSKSKPRRRRTTSKKGRKRKGKKRN